MLAWCLEVARQSTSIFRGTRKSWITHILERFTTDMKNAIHLSIAWNESPWNGNKYYCDRDYVDNHHILCALPQKLCCNREWDRIWIFPESIYRFYSRTTYSCSEWYFCIQINTFCNDKSRNCSSYYMYKLKFILIWRLSVGISSAGTYW